MAIGSDQTLPSPPPTPPQYVYPPVTIILTIILLVSFFICFFSIYFCRCFMHNLLYTWRIWHSPSGGYVGGAATSSASGGLDKSIVQSFPTFTYSSVKNYSKEKYGLECAICLVEFDDRDVLRHLTACCHLFHQECIDLWLETHKTCPVCRRNLESPVKCSTNYSNSVMEGISENEPIEDSYNITINDEHEDEPSTSANGEESNHHDQIEVGKFPRSNSTGHSIVRNRKEDRYTLRLPKHVKASIIKGHNSIKSWSTFGEYKNEGDIRHIVLAEISVSPSGDINKP